MEEKKLGLKSVISVSVGLVIATSCLVSLGQGARTDRSQLSVRPRDRCSKEANRNIGCIR